MPWKFDADLSADLEASATLFEAERGEAIPLPTRIATIVRDDLQHDPDVVRHQRQTGAPRTRPMPAGQGRRNGPPRPPVSPGAGRWGSGMTRAEDQLAGRP